MFSDYIGHDPHGREQLGEDELRLALADDLKILVYLRPLLETGQVVLFTPTQYCPYCLANESFGPDSDNRMERVFDQLLLRYSQELQVTVQLKQQEYRYNIKGPEMLLPHARVELITTEPGELQKMRSLMQRLQSGEKTTLSSREIKKTFVPDLLANPVIANVTFELAASQSLNTKYLTERTLDLEILNQLSQDPKIERRNQILQKHLTCVVPFLDEVSPADLV
jgi:hypothetical protein